LELLLGGLQRYLGMFLFGLIIEGLNAEAQVISGLTKQLDHLGVEGSRFGSVDIECADGAAVHS
jgi:hypothetical protein